MSKKQYDIFSMSHSDLINAYIETKKSLLELNLEVSRENVPNYSSRKRVLKKNIARLCLALASAKDTSSVYYDTMVNNNENK